MLARPRPDLAAPVPRHRVCFAAVDETSAAAAWINHTLRGDGVTSYRQRAHCEQCNVLLIEKLVLHPDLHLG